MAIYKLTQEQDNALFGDDTGIDGLFLGWVLENNNARVVTVDAQPIFYKFIKERFRVDIVDVDLDRIAELHGDPEDITYLLLHL